MLVLHPNKTFAEGRTALFAASNVEVVKVLLERGASAGIIDDEGCSALHYAGAQGRDASGLCALFKGAMIPR